MALGTELSTLPLTSLSRALKARLASNNYFYAIGLLISGIALSILK